MVISFEAIELWQGTVTEISDDHFKARLLDKLGDEGEAEAEIPLHEISDGDRGLLVEGAEFVWTVGYIDIDARQRIRASVVKLNRQAFLATEMEEMVNSAEQFNFIFEDKDKPN